MVKEIWKKELKTFLMVLIPIMIFFESFMILFFNLLLSPYETAYALNEFIILSFGLIYTAHLYQKYGSDFVIKISGINSISKKKLMTNLFSISFIFTFFFGITYLLLLVLFQRFDILVDDNIFPGSDGHSFNVPIYWYGFLHWDGIWYYLYSITLEILLIIVFAYVVNHYIKSKVLYSGLVAIILMWTVFLGTFFTIPISTHHISDTDTLVWRVHGDGVSTYRIIFLFVFPWTQISIIASYMFLSISKGYSDIRWWDYSTINSFSVLIWTPYLFLGFLLIFPTLQQTLVKYL